MSRVNLLSDKYSRKAAFHTEIRRVVAITVATFLFWILIVLVLSLTEGVLQAMVYRNLEQLQSEDSEDAERMAKLAAQARVDNERYEMFGATQNINPESLLAAISKMEDITADELLADAKMRTITISGRISAKEQVSAKEQLNEFIMRLSDQFEEVSLAALERISDVCFSFTVQVIAEDGL